MDGPASMLGRFPRWQMAGLCLGLIAIIALADSRTTFETLFALLYLLPVSLGTWYVGRSLGVALVVIATVAALVLDRQHALSPDLVGEIGILVTVAVLASRVKEQRASDRASRQLIEGIINAIPARVFWKNKSLVYLGCNAAFARDAGFADPKDIIGKDDYQMPWRDQAEAYRGDDRTVIESGRSKLLIEEPPTTAEGNSISLLTSKVPLRSPEGEVTGVIGTYLDVTEAGAGIPCPVVDGGRAVRRGDHDHRCQRHDRLCQPCVREIDRIHPGGSAGPEPADPQERQAGRRVLPSDVERTEPR